MTAGYPFRTARTDVGGHGMSYVDERPGGDRDAPPVLLVHGNPTWSFYYRRLLTALPQAGLRAVAMDHVGMGRSDKPAATDYPYTLSRRVADFGEFVDSLGLTRPVSLVVHDWGGPIALSWAVDHPEQVDRLVLLNTGAFPLPQDKRIPWSLASARLPGLGRFAVTRLNAFSLGAVVLGSGRRWLPAEARRGLLEPYRSPSDRVAVDAFVNDIPVSPHDASYAVLARTEERLRLLADRPALVCWGMKDPVFDELVLDRVEKLLPAAEVHRLPDAGHFVLEDAPEVVVPLVVQHLTATGPTTAGRG